MLKLDGRDGNVKDRNQLIVVIPLYSSESGLWLYK